MDRIKLIQRIIDKVGAKNYLEIGVNQGISFLPIRIKNKIGVDPKFRITYKSKLKWYLFNIYNLSSKYYESTSDNFFSNYRGANFDVIFIDGLHTYKQCLKDVNSSLNILNQSGIIIIHDCLPQSKCSAHPGQQLSQEEATKLGIDWTPEWCGDVWKVICNLRSQRDDLSVQVFDFDHGLGVVTKSLNRETKINYSHEDINKMTYDDLIIDKFNILNLKSKSEVNNFIERQLMIKN